MRLYLSFVLLCWFSFSFSQSESEILKEMYYEIHEYTISREGKNPLLHTGVYYENKYINAIGHPFLFADIFYNGHLVYKNRKYRDVKLKYDIFNQQLYINNKVGNTYVSNMLANEFITEFSILGFRFVKINGEDDRYGFYQVIAEESELSYYSFWYKSRSESMEGAYKKEEFDEGKQRRYLLINNVMMRFNKNRSFINLFPKSAIPSVKKYLKEHDINVNESDYEIMEELIKYCNKILAV